MHWEEVEGRNRLVLDSEQDVSRAKIVLEGVKYNKFLNAAIFEVDRPLPVETGHHIAIGVWNMAYGAVKKHGTPVPPLLNCDTTREEFDQALVGCDAVIDDITVSVD
jgi:hypothetical protein